MFKLRPLSRFKREAKRYASLPTELEQLFTQLSQQPITGTSLGKNCYKIRLSIASKGKEKSGGARVITCVVAVAEEVYLLAIYDKSEQASLSDADLQALLAEVPS